MFQPIGSGIPGSGYQFSKGAHIVTRAFGGFDHANKMDAVICFKVRVITSCSRAVV